MHRTTLFRRGAVLLASSALLLSAAACGSAASGSAGDGPIASGSAPAVSGVFDTLPVIALPNTKPPATTQVTIVTRGSGAALVTGDLAVVDDYGRTWASATAFENTFDTSTPPDTLPVGTGQLSMTGLDKALVGVPIGSRVLVVIPPNEGFGQVASLPTDVKKTDTAVLVFDVIAAYAPDAGPSGLTVSSGGGTLPTVTSSDLHSEPVIAMPKTAAPTTMSVTTLVQGSGPAVAKGQELVVQYVGQIWASGKQFDSSWSRKLPSAFPVGEGQLISAWDTGLVGVHVGSRVMIVAPPADAYGSAGQPSAGISGTDTLVFVVDVLGAYDS